MKEGFYLNPDDNYVAYIKKQIKENNGYCIYEDQHSKVTKCPKACKKSDTCPCGMYIKDYGYTEFDLD